MSRSSGNRKSRRRQLEASHQKNWLTGRYAILETLRAKKWPLAELFLADDEHDSLHEIGQLAEAADVVTRYVSSERLSELCHSSHHQGAAARMGLYPYETLESLLTSLTADTKCQSDTGYPVIVICDRIQDTFNFGAILRCCDAMNVQAVVIGQAEQTMVTPQVSRSSAGAVNHVSIVRISDLASAVPEFKTAGLRIFAASEKSEAAAWDIDLDRPMGLIVGSEARGISDTLLQTCDVHLRIPMLGQVESLNAAVAAGVLLYEIRRQQLSKAPAAESE